MKFLISLILFFFIGCGVEPAREKLKPEFNSISKNFFKQKCALYTCHSDAFYQKSGNLNLSYQKAYNNLVNIKSKRYPDKFRVKPGSPEESILINRLEGTLICGPTVERSRIEAEEINIIREWIKNGALND